MHGQGAVLSVLIRRDVACYVSTGDWRAEMEDLPSHRGCTVKSLAVGALLSLLIGVGAPYANMVIRGTYMALDFSTAGAIFLLFLLVAAVNVPLRALAGRAALSRSELIVVYIMMICASAIPTCGWTEYLLPILAAPFYYATPENNWAELMHRYIPEWIAPEGVGPIKQFYEGMPKGGTVPWGAWAKPLLAWGAFSLALYLVMISLAVLLRKQWMDRERLVYPLVQLPLEMAGREGAPNPLFRSGVMWMGFLVPFVVGTLNALHGYYHFIPAVRLASYVSAFRRTTTFIFRVSFPMVGFSYFIGLDIAFGIWFFNLLAKLQEGMSNVLGWTGTEQLGIYGIPAMPSMAHQKMGAMLMLVLLGLWVGRRQFREIGRRAFRGDRGADDSGEIMSYRAAVFCLIGGLAFLGAWLWRSGLPAWTVPPFLLAAVLLFIGVTRIVAEGGVAAARAPMVAPDFVVSGIGCPALGPSGLLALGFTYIWAADIRTFVMASCANGLKLAENIPGRKRPLFWAMMLSIVLGLVGSVWIVMNLSYAHGGINLNRWFFGGGALAPFNYLAPKLMHLPAANLSGWLHTAIGGGIMALLMLARHRFLWWPLHPLGFPIGGIWVVDEISFSVFLAWLFKGLVLKYGGPRLYRRTRPFFLGLILGQFTTAGLWLVVDFFTGMTDNPIFFQL